MALGDSYRKTPDFQIQYGVRADATWTVQAGMVFHIYVFAAGLSLSETVVVREDGPERLTTLDRKLFVC